MKLSNVVFLTVEDVVRIHARAIERFGGSPGIRDHGLLESAVMRAQTGYYGTLAELAAAYVHGLAKNHAFIDGNKRVAFGAGGAFLGANGHRLVLVRAKWTPIMLGVADGSVSVSTLGTHLTGEMGGAVQLEE